MLICPPSRSLSFLKADFAAVSFQLGFYTYQLFLSQDIKVEHAFASRESDRRMILNSIAGVSDLTASPDTSHPGWVTPQKWLLLMVLMAMILMTRMKRCLEQLLFISCLPKTLQTLSSACHGALSPAHSSALSWSFLCFDQWEIAQPAACMVWILYDLVKAVSTSKNVN